ncbi:MAG: acyltransferase [Lachnospiraceae bacterium]|nr:acyltransferase [Lachnospiraceae bacterium]
MTSFYTKNELQDLGVAELGEDVYISRKASIYAAENIKIGSHVRIDDFTILSGNISIGNYVHIAVYTALFGGTEGIIIGDFANISSRVAVYAISDDYSGEYMTNPMVSEKYKNTLSAKVMIGRHSIIATGCTVMPGVFLGEGCAVGAMSLVKESVEAWTIAAGIPSKSIKQRKQKPLELEIKFLQEENKIRNMK